MELEAPFLSETSKQNQTNKQTKDKKKQIKKNELLYSFNLSVLVSTYSVRAILTVLVKLKITAIVAIGHLVFSHPLVKFWPTLSSDLGYLRDVTKIYLNPLSLFQVES